MARLQRAVETTYYQTLGVPPSATPTQIHEAWKELALQLHPDTVVGESTRKVLEREKRTDQMATVNYAYSVLKDAKRRREYDAKLRLLRKPCAKCKGDGVVQKTRGFSSVIKITCPQCGGEGY